MIIVDDAVVVEVYHGKSVHVPHGVLEVLDVTVAEWGQPVMAASGMHYGSASIDEHVRVGLSHLPIPLIHPSAAHITGLAAVYWSYKSLT